jgi:hypothetical protein
LCSVPRSRADPATDPRAPFPGCLFSHTTTRGTLCEVGVCLGWRSLLNEPKYGPKPLNRFVFRSAGLHTAEGADRKAYTARTFRAPSADFVKRMQTRPQSARRNTPACLRYREVCQLRSAMMWLVRLACPGRRARTTTAPRPASTRWPPSLSEPSASCATTAISSPPRGRGP